MQTLTSEGAAPGVEPLDDECLDLQVATGVGVPDDDPTREIALADAVRLLYQVRAVHPDGTVSPWSASVAAGTGELTARWSATGAETAPWHSISDGLRGLACRR